MKNVFLLWGVLLVNILQAQVVNQETVPVFPACKSVLQKEQKPCFDLQLQQFVFNNFNTPAIVADKKYVGKIITLFEVDAEGQFQIIYIDALYPELKAEIKRVFSLLPKVEPGTFNGVPTYVKYTLNTDLPLKDSLKLALVDSENLNEKKPELESHEFDQVEKNYSVFSNPQFKSHLNIPFSHSYYSQIAAAMDQVGTNNHTGSKPFTYSEVSRYFDFEKHTNSLLVPKKSWWGRKLLNENLVAIQGKDYWFTLNPIFDLRLGTTSPNVGGYTYTNTRAIQLQGGLAADLVFSSSIYESQGYFPDYYNRLAIAQRPSGGNPAIIPGIGIAKEFKGNQFDFPSAEANLSYTPSKQLNLQLGYGRNFIGDGYRSLLESDAASPYPYFKINTTFWKIKYTNTYMWLKDVRPEVTLEKTYATKYMANHYLSWNVTKRWNMGFFESVVWANTNDRGFDVNFINPIIFYRSVEFASSSKSGNAALGLTSKYKWNNHLNFYGQFFIDEFSVGDMFGGKGSWKNKVGYQIGGKYFNAFGVPNLYLQAEYNIVRPYVYSHSEIITNYAHNNQNMGHNWGANLNEFIGIARYNKGRWFADAKLNIGLRGLDFDSLSDTKNYGSNIYKDYDLNRYADNGVIVGQGNKTKIFIADLNAGYLVNPIANLKLFANFIYRDFNPTVTTPTVFKETTTWFSIGLRSDVFNWYFDY